MTLLRGVLFDVDETLLDRAATLDAYLAGHMDRLALPSGEREGYRERYLELDAHGHGNRRVLASTLAREFPFWVRPAALMADFERHAWTAPRPVQGAEDVLQELRAMGMRVGALTNGLKAAQHAKLHRAGLRSLLDVVVVGTPRGLRKPDAPVFAHAVRQLGVDAAACLMVGDHSEHDIVGAHGLRTSPYVPT